MSAAPSALDVRVIRSNFLPLFVREHNPVLYFYQTPSLTRINWNQNLFTTEYTEVTEGK